MKPNQPTFGEAIQDLGFNQAAKLVSATTKLVGKAKTSEVRWPVSDHLWSRIHKTKDGMTTLCHMSMPAVYSEDVPKDAPRCKRCEGGWR